MAQVKVRLLVAGFWLAQRVVVREGKGQNDLISGVEKGARDGINHIAIASRHVTTGNESITGQLASA